MPHFGQYQFIISAMINAVSAYINGELSRKQQEALAEQNRKVAADTERNRQDFQREINEENALRQQELAVQNHKLRILEQENTFKLQANQAEWQHFLNNWPLVNLPSVVRRSQVLSDNTIALQVIFSKSNDPIFNKYVYPVIEQRLREFVEMYYNRFQSRNLIYYHNAYRSSFSGGGMDKNIHHALSDLPFMIVDANVLPNEIVVSYTMWDLGIQDEANVAHTMFRIPYTQQVAPNGNIVQPYYDAITKTMTASLKYVLGYAYDGYNLIHYNRAPLLPKVAALELEEKRYAPMLSQTAVCAQLRKDYTDLYTSVIGTGKQALAQLPGSFVQHSLPRMRLEFAESVKNMVAPAEFLRYLNESLDAWVNLRTTLTATDFLKDLLSDVLPVAKYYTVEDQAYFEKLKAHYAGTDTPYGTLVSQICDKLKTVDLQQAPRTISSNTEILPAKPQPSGRKPRKISM